MTGSGGPLGYVEVRAAGEELAERMRTDGPYRQRVLHSVAGKRPHEMTIEQYAAWCAEQDVRAAAPATIFSSRVHGQV
jgi:hypothetical protein